MVLRKLSIAIFLLALGLTQSSYSQGNRYLLMEGTGEFGWSINRVSKINGEAEGRALALAAVNSQVNSMANLISFEQFSRAEIRKTLSNKFEQIDKLMKNTTTFTSEQNKNEAFKGNLRGLVVTVEDRGFKPGTFANSSQYNNLTGVRKSKASGIYLYTFRVYAPQGYNPNAGGSSLNGNQERASIRYTLTNTTNQNVLCGFPVVVTMI